MLNEIKHYQCSRCILSQPRLDVETGRICRKFNIPVKDTDFCSWNTQTVTTCECCGNQFVGNPIYISKETESNKYSLDMVVCADCSKALHTCKTCVNMNICSFETDPSPLPKIVQKQVKQGFMTAVTQVMNPERIRITCEKNCPCYSSDFSCQKQNRGTCPQYRTHRV